MKQNATVKWVHGLTYVGTAPSGHSIIISSGDEKSSTSPMNLVLLAVVSCSAVDVVSILEKKHMQVTGLEIRASGERAEEHPRAFKSIHLDYRVRGAELTDEAIARAIELSESKYCSVAATLRNPVDISTSHVLEDKNVPIPTV